MSKVTFKNTRFDPGITPFEALALQIAKAYGYSADLDLDKKLAQLIRLRVAQKNECAYCIILHARTAREIGIAEEKVDNISSWYNSGLFTQEEKACLAYTDALSEGIRRGFQTYHEQLSRFFSEKEIAEIAAVVINMNIWTRLKLAQGQVPVMEEAEAAAR